MRPLLHSCLGAVILASCAIAGEPQPGNSLTEVRFWTFSDTTRIVLETTGDFDFVKDRVANPDRLFFDLSETTVRIGRKRYASIAVNDPRLKQIRVAETQPGVARIVFDLEEAVDYMASRLTNPARLIVELRAVRPLPVPPVVSSTPSRIEPGPRNRPYLPPPPVNAEPVLTDSAPPLPKQTVAAIAPAITPKSKIPLPPPPKPARLDTRSMTRVLGLKVGRIVLDPGHGGHDTGTSGPGGLLEKDLVLDVCRRLGSLIESRMGAEVVYTRQDDTFIPLERRTEIANKERADLFLSIHANSSSSDTSSGVETYYLNFTDSNSAMEIAARENAGSAKTVYELKDLVHRIALHDKIDESRQFAARVQQSLYNAAAKANSRTRDRGVKKAPFVVLIGASMPSVLAEIGFVTNPKDEALFRKPEFRQKVAEGLYHGISRYASTLSQFQVAQK